MLQIAIVGIGAMGCLFAAHLTPLANVSMLGHWSTQLAALRHGLTLITNEGAERQIAVRASRYPQHIAPVDIALVLVKSYQTQQAAHDIDQFLSNHGVALTLQNGVGNDLTMASVLGAERVLAGSTTEGATLVSPGMVRHAGRGKIFLPEPVGHRAPLILDLVALLREAGFTVSLTSNIEAILWQKVAVNAAINPLTALVEAPNGFLLSSDAASQIARHATREAAQVARAQGYTVNAETAVRQTFTVAKSTRRNISSMLQDLRKQRPTELDAITGAVIRAGQDKGIPTPYNEALYALLTQKMSGTAWTKGIPSLPHDLQSTFRQLNLERKNASFPNN